MELVVVDASVAAKWVIAEPETAIANEYLAGAFSLAAPAIIRIEVNGAAIRGVRRGTLTESVARATVERWEQMIAFQAVRLFPSEDVLAEAIELAFRCKHALADCLYLALAQKLDVKLITADRALHQRALAIYDRVELLPRAA